MAPAPTDTRAAAVARRLAEGTAVRIAGSATKAGWGRPVDGLPELSTRGLDRIVAHEPGDFTAVLEAGVRLADAQAAFAAHGQRLALDPPGAGATIGGIVASGDSGPLRHRYGAPRDLVIGIALALPDGTVARAGGRVIKNVAGYDLAKLAAGAFGTLGVITEVCVRLHPLPAATATAVFRSERPERLRAIVLDLAHRPLELESLDLAPGAILARFAGATAAERAAGVRPDEVVEDDEGLWEAQRGAQRSADGIVVRVAGLPTDLATVLRAASTGAAARDAGGATPRVVGRAGAGTFWVTLPSGGDVAALRRALAPRPCVVTDAPAEVRGALDPWDLPEGPALELMRRVRDRFDPGRVCNGELMPT